MAGGVQGKSGFVIQCVRDHRVAVGGIERSRGCAVQWIGNRGLVSGEVIAVGGRVIETVSPGGHAIEAVENHGDAVAQGINGRGHVAGEVVGVRIGGRGIAGADFLGEPGHWVVTHAGGEATGIGARRQVAGQIVAQGGDGIDCICIGDFPIARVVSDSRGVVYGIRGGFEEARGGVCHRGQIIEGVPNLSEVGVGGLRKGGPCASYQKNC